MNIYALYGLPGSGKTTYSTQLAEQCEAKIYHYDEFKIGSRPQDSEATHQRLFALIIEDLRNGHDVVLDDLHLALEWRTRLLRALDGVPCTKVLLVMTTPLDECICRDAGRPKPLGEHIIKHLHGRYQPPSLDEGWDDILFI